MADFKTHITVSSALGVAYGAAGHFLFGLEPEPCLLATGLCSVSGMLPDLDSDSGVPLRESIAFAAAVVPMLMIPRFRTMGFAPETMVIIGSAIYLAIRFGLGKFLKKYTVHRGMFHSLPAALIATEIAFMVYSRKDTNLRYYVSLAVAAGFMSHLILDEIWSIGVKRGQINVKKSFGTAVKLWGDDRWANISCYGKLLALSYIVLHDPVWMYDGTPPLENFKMIAQKVIDKVGGDGGSWFSGSGDDEEKDLVDAPPLKEVPKIRFGERNIRVNEPTDPRTVRFRNDPFWDEQARPEPQEYAAPANPRFRDEEYQAPRYNQRPRFQR